MKGLLVSLLLSVATIVSAGPLSRVVDLTHHTFSTILEDPSNGLFLLKFYAPWCGHCKRMAPVLDEVAPKVAGQMAIGKIDCTVEKKLCKQHNVKAFPTLKFYKDGDFFDYPGGRTAEELISFAGRMSRPAMQVVTSYDEALGLIEKEEPSVGFVLYDKSVEGEDLQKELQVNILTQVFSQVARKQQAMANFYVLIPKSEGEGEGDSPPTPALQIPGHEKVSDSFVMKIEPELKAVMWKTEDISSLNLIQFITEQNVPLVSALGPSNFHKVGHIGKPLVIGCIDGSDEEQVKTTVDELTKYAQEGPEEITAQYYFAWMDGKLWKKFFSQFDVHSVPQWLVLHVPTKSYYQNETFTKLESFLQAIDDGVVEMKSVSSQYSGVKGFFKRLIYLFLDNMPLSLVAVVALICLLVVVFVMSTGDDEFGEEYERLRKEEEREQNDVGNDETSEQEEPKKEK